MKYGRKEKDRMKKYIKPELFYENFEMSKHIASCAWDMSNSKTVEECFAKSDPEWGLIDNISAFNTGVVGCTDGPLESYCYSNGSSENNIFNS